MTSKFSKRWFLLLSCFFAFQSCSMFTKQPKDILTAEIALCELATLAFIKNMSFVDIYRKNWLRQCKKITDPDLLIDVTAVYTDSSCEKELPYYRESIWDLCKNEIVLSDISKNYLGNPKAWTNIEAGIEPLQTPWTLSQAARINLNVYDQTKNHRPFLKKVQYREVPTKNHNQHDASDCSLGMWVFKKDPTATNLKPFIFIHGGAWKYRGAAASIGVPTTVPNLTEMGYIVFSPFYRLVGNDDGPAECQNAIWSDIFEDIEAAYSWIAKHGEEFGMQPLKKRKKKGYRKMAIGGQSAGSHLSTYMAVTYPEKIDRAFLLYPPTDLKFFINNTNPHCGANCLYSCRFPMAKSVLPQYCGVETYDEIDPTSDCIQTSSFPEIIQERKKKKKNLPIPPMFLIQGSADSFTPIELNIRLCQALAGEPLLNELYNGCDLSRSCGSSPQAKTQLRVVAGADHMLDLRCLNMNVFKGLPCTPGSKEGEEKVREYLGQAYEFLRPE